MKNIRSKIERKIMATGNYGLARKLRIYWIIDRIKKAFNSLW